MDDHLTILIDLLGFSHAVRTREGEELNKLIELVRQFASLRSDAHLDRTGSELRIKPSVSTFSDHIVISYPLANLEGLSSGLPLDFGMHMVNSWVGWIAAGAANLGLLIRGGITVGTLYHEGHVVVGKAMNEAHELESRYSIYPRIAVSRKVYSRLAPGTLDGVLAKDDDGIVHLNYFAEMAHRLGDPTGPGYASRVQAKCSELKRLTELNIQRFEEDECWKELAKWAWFKKRFDEGSSRLLEIFRDSPLQAAEGTP